MKPRPLPRKFSLESRAGFTLIELLLVLVILGVLAAVVVPKFTKRAAQAKVTAAQTDISNAGMAISTFEVDNGRYPTSQEGLAALVEQPAGLTTWKGPYIEHPIANDPWGNPYMYRSPGQHNTESFDLYSFGPDGQEGGTDDVTNWTQGQ